MAMKFKRQLIVAMRRIRLFFLCLFPVLFMMAVTNCGAEKDVSERRNLMMPKKSEMMRNEKYKEVSKRKTNKIKQPKRKRKSLF
jgi:hypothetical protein